MQGTAIAGLTIAMNGIDAAETAAGPGLRVSSRQQPDTKNTLFTEILHQKGNAAGEEAKAGLLGEAEDAERTDELGDGGNSDVCGLLMQMLVMNNAASGQPASGQNAAASQSGTANSAAGNLAAATAPLQSDNTPASELTAQAEQAELSKAAGEAADVKQGISSAFREKLMDAMSRAAQFEGGTTEQDGAAAEKTAEANSAATPDAGEQSQAAQTSGAGADSFKNSFGQAVSAAAQDGGLKNGQTGTLRELKTETKDTNAAPSVTAAGSVETAEGSALTEVSATDGGQTDGGMGELLSDDDAGTPPDRNVSDPTVLNTTLTNTTYGGVDAAETAAAVEKAFNRFAEDVRGLQAGVNEIKIVLEPESLGTMTISVLRTENGISAKIKADDKQVCEVISGQIQKLLTSLESRGIHVEEMDVSYSQADQSNGFSQQNFSGGRDESARERSFPQNMGNGGSDYTEAPEVPNEPAGPDKLLEYRL